MEINTYSRIVDTAENIWDCKCCSLFNTDMNVPKVPVGAITKASYERAYEQLLAAATFSDTHDIHNVSDRIFVGNINNIGDQTINLMDDTTANKRLLPGSFKEGPANKRLHITENTFECSTCGETKLKCPGHYEHIESNICDYIESIYPVDFAIYSNNDITGKLNDNNKLI